MASGPPEKAGAPTAAGPRPVCSLVRREKKPRATASLAFPCVRRQWQRQHPLLADAPRLRDPADLAEGARLRAVFLSRLQHEFPLANVPRQRGDPRPELFAYSPPLRGVLQPLYRGA